MTTPDDAGAYLTHSEAAKLRPGRGGKPLSPATLTRWILAGVRGRDGGRVRLKAERFGSRWSTRADRLDAFIDAQTAGFVGRDVDDASLLRTPA